MQGSLAIINQLIAMLSAVDAHFLHLSCKAKSMHCPFGSAQADRKKIIYLGRKA